MQDSMILTMSGRRIDLNAISACHIHPDDIAGALGRHALFSGHSLHYYSAAEHALNLADALPSELKLRALVSQAHLAYLAYEHSTIEWSHLAKKRIMQAVNERFGLSNDDDAEAQIEYVRLKVRSAELRDLFIAHPSLNQLPPPPRYLKIGITMSANMAVCRFMRRFRELYTEADQSPHLKAIEKTPSR